MDNALNEKDTNKKKVLMEIYTYAIGKKKKNYLKTKNLLFEKKGNLCFQS